MTDEERALIDVVFHRGPSALIDAGYTQEAGRAFLDRSDVQVELATLGREFDNQDVINALTRFSMRRKMTVHAKRAVEILATALEGPDYLMVGGVVCTDISGRPILRRPEPTAIQVKAAEEILDRLNVTADKQVIQAAGVNVNILFKNEDKKEIEISTDPKHTTEEQRSLSRQRVRNAIEILAQKFPDMKMVAAKMLEMKSIPKTAVKHGAKKKAAKKPAKKPAKKAKKKVK